MNLIRLRSNSSRGLHPRSRKFATAGLQAIYMINYSDFEKLQIRIGLIVEAEKVEGTAKLLKLKVDFGNDPSVSSGRLRRQIVSGIAEFYKPEQLVGKQFPFVVNLIPRIIRGIESQGMILAVDVNGKAVLLKPHKKVPAGSLVK